MGMYHKNHLVGPGFKRTPDFKRHEKGSEKKLSGTF